MKDYLPAAFVIALLLFAGGVVDAIPVTAYGSVLALAMLFGLLYLLVREV